MRLCLYHIKKKKLCCLDRHLQDFPSSPTGKNTFPKQYLIANNKDFYALQASGFFNLQKQGFFFPTKTPEGAYAPAILPFLPSFFCVSQ